MLYLPQGQFIFILLLATNFANLVNSFQYSYVKYFKIKKNATFYARLFHVIIQNEIILHHKTHGRNLSSRK